MNIFDTNKEMRDLVASMNGSPYEIAQQIFAWIAFAVRYEAGGKGRFTT